MRLSELMDGWLVACYCNSIVNGLLTQPAGSFSIRWARDRYKEARAIAPEGSPAERWGVATTVFQARYRPAKHQCVSHSICTATTYADRTTRLYSRASSLLQTPLCPSSFIPRSCGSDFARDHPALPKRPGRDSGLGCPGDPVAIDRYFVRLAQQF